MKELKGNLKSAYLVIIIYFLSLLFSAVMFTLSLMYDVLVSLFISIGSGVISCIGIFYSAYIIIKIKQKLNIVEK